MKGHFLKALERFTKIEWDKIEGDERPLYKQYMDGKLVQEYFRRMAVFLNYISSNLNIKTPTLISAAECIGYDYKSSLDIVDTGIKLENYHIKRLCKSYLAWSILVDMGEPTAIKFYDLYDPMIKLLEIGGGHIWMHHGSLIGGDGFGMHDFYRSLSECSPIDISDDVLFDMGCAEIKNGEESLQEYLDTDKVTKRCLRCGDKIEIDSSFSWKHNDIVYTNNTHYVVRCSKNGCFKIQIRKKNEEYRTIKNLKGEEFEKEKRNLINEYNRIMDSYNRQGINCPRCGGKELRYLNKDFEKKSLFICRTCGRSFGLGELQKKTN